MTTNGTVTRAVLHELERRGMTRAAFARLLNQNPAWVTHKLNGHRRWSVDDLDLVAERLGIPVAWLLMPPAPVGAGQDDEVVPLGQARGRRGARKPANATER